MDNNKNIQTLADKHYMVRMLVGLATEIIGDMQHTKYDFDRCGFAYQVRQLVTTVRMLEEVME